MKEAVRGIPRFMLGAVFAMAAGRAAVPAAPEIHPAPHSLSTEYPGRPILPLWGWETTPFYQRENDRVMSTTEMLTRAVDESFRRGANLLEIYRGGHPIERRADWTLENTRRLHREVHARDMLIHWFPHRLAAYETAGSRVTFLGATGAATGSQTFDGALAGVREFGELYDTLGLPSRDVPDGLGTEQWPEMHARLFDLIAWPYNPALYYYTDNHMPLDTLPNEIDVSASNGFGSDNQTTGYYQLRDEIRKEGGLQFWGSQAECRTGRLPGNVFGGRGHPDWIVKQVSDQFRARARARGERLVSPSALWWINEADNMCPDENRAYVYGVSQDPIRGAVAANLTMLGEGGYAPGGRGLPQRFPHPASSTFIQNNYLRVVVLPDGRMELLHDPERLAQYDNVSPAMRLSPSLLNTTHPAGRVIDSTVEIVEPAGYLSVVESRLELEANGRGFSETRTLTMQSDSPWLRLRVRRNGPPGRFVSRVDLPDYDRIEVGDEIANVVPRSSLAPLVVSCTDGARPPLALLATEPGGLRSFSWGDGHLDLHSDSAEPFEIALVLLDGLYRSQQRYELLRFLSTPRESMAMPGEGGATVQNLLGMPVVEVVRVRSNARGPYHVREFGRWMHRGAQPSRLHPGEDYVKVYLPAQGRAEIRDYGFIDGIARPGWGCQYTTAIVDCTREQSRCAVDVEVNDITSFLFAPRLRFAEPIARAWLDGAPWSYLDGDELFLPNRQGRYHVEIEAGAATEPHLARTFADISQASSTMNTLTFTARLPEWTESVPDGFHFAALIRHPGRELRGLENARLLRGGRDASMIQFDTGEVSARFDGALDFAAVSPEGEVEAYLCDLSAEMVRACLASFRVVDIVSASDDCDVFVWNRYFQDVPCPRSSGTVADFEHDRSSMRGADFKTGACPFREEFLSRVEEGKGMLLLCNAVGVLADVTGTSVYYGHHAPVQAVGLAPRAPEHPVFAGLPGPRVTVLARRNFAVYKWMEVSPSMFGPGRRVLAELAVDWTGDAADRPLTGVPALWEEARGKGKILACAVGLAYGLGGLPRHPQHEEAARLLENAVRYLAGKDDPVVGLVRLRDFK